MAISRFWRWLEIPGVIQNGRIWRSDMLLLTRPLWFEDISVANLVPIHLNETVFDKHAKNVFKVI